MGEGGRGEGRERDKYPFGHVSTATRPPRHKFRGFNRDPWLPVSGREDRKGRYGGHGFSCWMSIICFSFFPSRFLSFEHVEKCMRLCVFVTSYELLD